MKRFEVEVVSRQRALCIVEAGDADAAQRLAAARWRQGDPSDLKGFDWSELEGAHAVEALDVDGRLQDEELIRRFVRERERLLLKLGGGLESASVNDAISAAQVAADLGWIRTASEGLAVARASEALASLCQKKRLVCFEKPRVREGERGEIRLYCTPDYLEVLSTTIIASAQSPS